MIIGKQGDMHMAEGSVDVRPEAGLAVSPGVTRLPVRATAAGGNAQRYVRVTNGDHRGYVEFQFSIGDPALFLDMTLPAAAFAEFCTTQRARHLSATEAAAVDASEARWRNGTDILE